MIGASIAIFVLSMSLQLFDTVKAGEYVIHQWPITGTIEAHTQPGTFLRMFGDVHRYNVADVLVFDADGAADVPAIHARFNDGASADIWGSLRFQIPSNVEKLIELHKQFRSYAALKREVLKIVEQAVYTGAPMMSAFDSFKEGRLEFQRIVKDMTTDGVWIVESKEETYVDPIDNQQKTRYKVFPRRDEKGDILREASLLKRFDVLVLDLRVKGIKYEQRVLDQIQAQQEAQMASKLSVERARKARQDAVTAEEEGKAAVMREKYTKETEKIRAVVDAERDKEVAVLGAQQQLEAAKLLKQASVEEADAVRIRAKADAEAAKMRIEADGALSVRKEAFTYAVDKMSAALAAHQLVPNVVIGGGTGANAASSATSMTEAMMGMMLVSLGKNMIGEDFTPRATKPKQ